jgi:hypothetical protein
MNWAWWDGKMTEEHYKEEHPLDSDTVKDVVTTETKPVKPTEKGE